MNPQVGQPQNPYIDFLNKLRSQSAPQAPGQNPMQNAQNMMQKATQPAGASQPGGAPVGQMLQGQGAGLPGSTPQEIEDATIPGQNPGVSKQLLGAMSQLHQVITALSDPQEIRMVRTIIIMLNNLIQRDQEVQNQKTGSMRGQNPGDSNFGPTLPNHPGMTPGQPMGGAPQPGMPTGQPQGAPNPAM